MRRSEPLSPLGGIYSPGLFVSLVLTVSLLVPARTRALEGTIQICVDQAHSIPLSAQYPRSIALLPETHRLAVATQGSGLLVFNPQAAKDERITTSILKQVYLPASQFAARKFVPLFKTSINSQGHRKTTLASATFKPLKGYLDWMKSTGRHPYIFDMDPPLQLALERGPGNEFGTIQVRNLADLEIVGQIRLKGKGVRMARLSPDGTLFFCSYSAPDADPPEGRYGVEAQIRAFPGGEVVANLPAFGNPLSDAGFSRDGRLLLVATGITYDFAGIGGGIVEGPDHRVLVFTIPDGKQTFQWADFEKPVRFATFNSDETLILAGSGNRLSILDWKGDRERIRLVVPDDEKEFISADITSDGRTVYTLQEGGILRSWDLGDALK